LALALPAELKLSCPGRALASAMSSLIERAGTDGCSATTRLTTVTWLTGTRSFSESNGIFLMRLGLAP
jgi:hypothetical protein